MQLLSVRTNRPAADDPVAAALLAAQRHRPSWLARLAGIRHVALLSLALVAWEAWSRIGLDAMSRTLLPPPSVVISAAYELILSGELLHHLVASLERELAAFAWAALAIPLGILMGWYRPLERQLDPIIEMLRPIPPIAWIPLSILWFGIGDVQNQFIIFLGIFFPILINTVTGVKGIETNLIRAARSLGANEAVVIRRVALRAALPQILTGVRVGLGVGWMALVAAELVGANSGLGFLINDARTVLRTDYVIVGMVTIGLIGLLLDRTIRMVARRMLPWWGAGR